MKKIKLTKYLLAAVLAFSISSCHDDLDLKPNDPDVLTEGNVFGDTTEAKHALAKVYASLAITGQVGPLDNQISKVLMKVHLNLHVLFLH